MFDDQRLFLCYLQEVDAGSTQRFSTQRPVALPLCVSPPGWMERYPRQRRKRLGFTPGIGWFENLLYSVVSKVRTLISGEFLGFVMKYPPGVLYLVSNPSRVLQQSKTMLLY